MLQFKLPNDWTMDQLNDNATFIADGNDLLIEFTGGGSIRIQDHGSANSFEELNTKLVF